MNLGPLQTNRPLMSPAPSAPSLCFRTVPNVERRRTSCQAESDKIKKRKAFGEWMLETDDPSLLDQPPEKDFWEGSQFDIIGKSAGFAIPLLAVLGILVGLFAASGYNGGATAVLKPPTSPDDAARILPGPQ